MEKTKQQGFTLTELMVTIAIVAILATIAVPSFKTMIVNNRIQTTANRFKNSLVQARSLAIQKEDLITISITPVASKAHFTEWEAANSGGTALFSEKAGLTVIMKEITAATSTTVTTMGDAPDIVYSPDGSIDGVTDLTQRVFSICYKDSGSKYDAKAVILSPSGLAVIKNENQMIDSGDDSDGSNDDKQAFKNICS